MDFQEFEWPFNEIHARIREIDENNNRRLSNNRFVPTHRRGKRRTPRDQLVRHNVEERRQLARHAAHMRADNRREIRQLDREILQGLHRRLNRVDTSIQALMNQQWEQPWSHREELIDLEIQRSNLQDEINGFNRN